MANSAQQLWEARTSAFGKMLVMSQVGDGNQMKQVGGTMEKETERDIL
jgi:hypothetical protein